MSVSKLKELPGAAPVATDPESGCLVTGTPGDVADVEVDERIVSRSIRLFPKSWGFTPACVPVDGPGIYVLELVLFSSPAELSSRYTLPIGLLEICSSKGLN